MKGCSIDLAALSSTGSVRQKNQDAVAVDAQMGGVVLADGVGSHAHGGVASQLAVKNLLPLLGEISFLSEALQEKELGRIHAFMREGIRECNQKILSSAAADPQFQGMASTLLLGLFVHERLFHCHLGDSRIYRLRQGDLQQLTKDHTQVQEYFDATGLHDASIPENAITRALGVQGNGPDCGVSPLQPGDRYLFCSDGITKDLAADALREFLGQPLDAATIARSLIDGALANGGSDNITVAVACIGN